MYASSSLNTGDKGLIVDDPEFVRKTEELNRLNDTLAILLRDLKSAQHAADIRERKLRNVPRDQRYAPISSVKNQQREISELITDAAEIQKLVEALLQRICMGDEMEGAHSVAELIEKVSHGHECGKAEQLVSDQPAYVPYVSGHFQASPESAAVMAYVAIRALVLVSKKLTGKNRPKDSTRPS